MSREAGRSIGGLVCQAKHGAVISAKGVKGARDKFEREADPAGVLPLAERRRRGELLYRAHMRRLAIASAAARKKR
jgi:hypothetical protein